MKRTPITLIIMAGFCITACANSNDTSKDLPPGKVVDDSTTIIVSEQTPETDSISETNISQKSKEIINTSSEKVKKTYDKSKEAVTNAAEKAAQKTENAYDKSKEAVTNAAEKAKSEWNNIKEKIKK